jgi:hypothetical protein
MLNLQKNVKSSLALVNIASRNDTVEYPLRQRGHIVSGEFADEIRECRKVQTD